MALRIRRRTLLAAAGAAACAAALPRAWAAAKDKMRKPNIIMILADDLGYGDVGCYGATWLETPAIDRMAAEGLRFTDFHANCPVCSPTRAALLTGRYQQRTGIEGVITAGGHRDKGLPLDEVTFAEILRDAGYTTAVFGKWHLGYDPAFNPTHQGFETFRGYVSGNVDYHSHVDQAGHEDWWAGAEKAPEDGYTTDLITEHAVRFIRAHRDRPFCLYLPHEAPHYPYQGRGDSADRAPGKGQPSLGSREDRKAAYREMVAALDEGVGRVLEAVREVGVERDTLVLFVSDNGPAKVGEAGPLRGGKSTLWEGGHRVPAIAWWPGRIAPGTSDEIAMTMDLAPTFAAIAGSPMPAGVKIDGVDLSPVLFERKPLAARPLFWRFGKQRAAREGKWKLMVEGGKRQLFDLDADLGETTDLASKAPDRVRRLSEALDAWEKDVARPDGALVP